MAKLSRLKGAILAEDSSNFWLIGQLKEPCNFENFGFENPGEIQAPAVPFIKLVPKGPAPAKNEEAIFLDLEGEKLAKKSAELFMITRNGAISERLWDLVTESSAKKSEILDCKWLGDTPEDIWDIVRDSVLRC